MVCGRCILAVENLLENHHISYEKVELGRVLLKEEIDDKQKEALSKDLLKIGFELLQDEKDKLIAQIKAEIVHLVHYREDFLKINLSDYLSEKFHRDYSSLSQLFSKHTGYTIERYLILQKVERIKELLAYGEKTISEISYMLNYSSPAHLSAQFKKITGLSPSQFRKLEQKERKKLDDI